jgi:predicted transcriptional regulator
MKISEAKRLLDAEVLCGEDMLEDEVFSACGADMMSDVLAFVKNHSMLLTGLINHQVIRTAEMMDIHCIVFVRGKTPPDSILELAKESNIVLMKTKYRMYSACGILFEAGLKPTECDRV